MSFWASHKMAPVVTPDGPERPSHFDEDQNVYAGRNQTEQDFPTLDSEPDVQYGAVPPQDPIPVYMIEPAPSNRDLIRWMPGSATVDNTATAKDGDRTQLVTDDINRRRLVVYNNDTTNAVYLSTDAMNSNAAFSFTLGAGKSVEFFHNRAMWAFCESTKSAAISWFSESVIPT